MLKANPIQYGYTNKGNQYAKSTKCRKIGATLGFAAYTTKIGFRLNSKKLFAKSTNNSLRGIMNAPEELVEQYSLQGLKSAKTGKEFLKQYIKWDPQVPVEYTNKFFNAAKSKPAKIALVAGIFAINAGIYALCGRLIGNAFDKAKDAKAMEKADQEAQAAKQ